MSDSLRSTKLFPHEWIAGGVAALSVTSLMVRNTLVVDPAMPALTHRALANIATMAGTQVAGAVAAGFLALLCLRMILVRTHMKLVDPSTVAVACLRVCLTLMAVIVVHQTIPLWQHITARPDVDFILIAWDQWLFGGTIPAIWFERWISPGLTAYMWAVYLAWFVVFQGVMYLLALTRESAEWEDMMLGTVCTFILGYVGYVIVPAVGPVHALAARFTVSLDGSAVSAMTNGIVDHFGVWRDAFPSIHAAVSALIMFYAWRYLRRWFLPFGVLGCSILVSTVYLRWHYVVDVLAGVALSLTCFLLAPRLLRYLRRYRSVPTTAA